ncbi:DUF4149 domain-containing protein [Viridibacterium curvum]|uniref:DUF4149 domain-containing protein n=1 Tax=Viridibacterium curvum TaxID=1101404 RepID=A0ABP9QXV9_9RHOO
MRQFGTYLFTILITLWVGSLWAFGFAAALLQKQLADRTLAGNLAGQLFAAVAWLGMLAGVYGLIYLFRQSGAGIMKTLVFWLMLLMLLLTVAAHFGITPILSQLRADALPHEVLASAFRSRFLAWHGVSSLVYLIEAAMGLVLVTQLFKR